MNRERAETYLRLLAEAELRDPALRPPPCAAVARRAVRHHADHADRAAWALTAVGALDLETAEAILADAELAVAARRRPEAAVVSSAGPRLGPRRFAGGRPLARMSHDAVRFARPGARPIRGRARPAGGPGPASRQPGRTLRPVRPGRADDLVPRRAISGELDLMSYAHTAAGARFIATWQTRDLLGARHHGPPPVDAFTVTDDRGKRYDLVLDPKGRPQPTCDLALRPDPPPDIGWLEITAPGEQAVRVDLEGRAERPAPEVSDRAASASASTC